MAYEAVNAAFRIAKEQNGLLREVMADRQAAAPDNPLPAPLADLLAAGRIQVQQNAAGTWTMWWLKKGEEERDG